jgi:hypothetical protein
MTQTNISDFDSKSQSQTSEESNEENDNTGTQQPKRNEFSLDGLRANDPLAFLAAVGTVRALDSAETTERPKLSWTRAGSNWTPTLHVEKELSREQLLEILTEYLTDNQDALRYTMSNDPSTQKSKLSNLDPEEFQELLETVELRSENEQALAAYGTDAFTNHSEIAEFSPREQGTAVTRLDIVEFSGPLCFLKGQRRLVEETTRSKLRETLFELWEFSDDASGHRTMRWSPTDAKRGAYTGVDPTNLDSQTVHGANRLAIEGSRLYTVIPHAAGSETVGFVQLETGEHVFQYPIWSAPVGVRTIQTLLVHPELMSGDPAPEQVQGIEKVLRAEVEVNDRYRNLGRGIPVN